MTPLQMAIIQTIAYADIFDYPLTATEIHRFLIIDATLSGHNEMNHRKLRSKSITQTSVNSVLSVLQKKHRLETENHFYFLPTRQSIVSLRQQREKISHSKITRAKTLTQKLALLPTVQGIFLTGALAMHNSGKSDDIDLLLITRPNTLWSTRLVVNLLTDTLNLRRRPQQLFHLGGGISSATSEVEEKNHSNKLCLNMWLDQTALALPKAKQNLYTAHEVAQVIPLMDKNHTYEQFLLANSWITRYLPNIPLPLTKASGTSYVWELEGAKTNKSKLSPVEQLAFHLQYHYMRQKITRETITPHAAFFHPRDTSRQVMKTYDQKTTIILGQLDKLE